MYRIVSFWLKNEQPLYPDLVNSILKHLRSQCWKQWGWNNWAKKIGLKPMGIKNKGLKRDETLGALTLKAETFNTEI